MFIFSGVSHVSVLMTMRMMIMVMMTMIIIIIVFTMINAHNQHTIRGVVNCHFTFQTLPSRPLI